MTPVLMAITPLRSQIASDEQAATSRFTDKDLAFLQKPYEYEELMDAIRKALNQ